MRDTVYVVIRDTYGATSYPKAIRKNRENAIRDAIELSGATRDDWNPHPSDSYRSIGSIKNGMRHYEVHELPVGCVLERYLDTNDHGPNAPERTHP